MACRGGAWPGSSRGAGPPDPVQGSQIPESAECRRVQGRWESGGEAKVLISPQNSPTPSAGRSEQESWSLSGARSTNQGAPIATPARSHCAQWMDGSGEASNPAQDGTPHWPAPAGSLVALPPRNLQLQATRQGPQAALIWPQVGGTLALPPAPGPPASAQPSHQLGLGSGPSCLFIELWILL